MSQNFQELLEGYQRRLMNQFLEEIRNGDHDKVDKQNKITLPYPKFNEFKGFLRGSLKKNCNNTINRGLLDIVRGKTYLMDQDNIIILNGKINRITGLEIENGVATFRNEYYTKKNNVYYEDKVYHIYKFVDNNHNQI